MADIVVEHLGKNIDRGDRIEWRDGDTVIDLTGCKIIGVDRSIEFGKASAVTVTFLARLVEVQQEEPS